MRTIALIAAAAGICALQAPALADASASFDPGRAAQAGNELPPYLQCVPYARQLSGVQIYGDAHTWWDQAAGRYERGNEPRVGAVMAFMPHRSMRLGHVATVSRVIDSRTVLLDHANWSPINGRRGQIERNVKAVDVSPANDWSQVRVWYHPIGDLGTTPWPVHGFIYSEKPNLPQVRLADARSESPASRPSVPQRRASGPDSRVADSGPSRAFLSAFSDIAPAPGGMAAGRGAVQAAPQRKALPRRKQAAGRAGSPGDPIAAALARYGS
ncbi:MAG: CHAP domain-containing protein [Pseudomonadota bacterium]|nr:CHAP domain-containing protein [Pseudomonadota bacterium]